MPLTITNITGDGVFDDLFAVTLTLPDTGTVVAIDGRVQPIAGASVAVTGSPLAIPAAPTTGSVFYNVQVDTVTGLATVQQSTTADPVPISASARVVFRQTLVLSSTDPALTPSSTPDTY